MKSFTSRLLLSSLLLVSILLVSASGVGAGPASMDYDVANGHFYAQAVDSGQSGRGFRITDDDGILFWSEYQRLGGVKVLGYPISRRFTLDGTMHQATQRGIMQWQPDSKRVDMVNLVDYLGSRPGGEDGLAAKGVPKGAQIPANQSWEQAMLTRLPWLDANPAIKEYYYQGGLDRALLLYGFPASRVIDQAEFAAIRLQRGALIQWKKEMPWTKAGEVTAANMGEIARELGVVPGAALTPEDAPPQAVAAAEPPQGQPAPQPKEPPKPAPTPVPTPAEQAKESNGGQQATGLATWYGEPYHGRRTASGEVFDMNNPTTAACNIFPLGTWLKVTRVDNGASVTVRVNDRGGFKAPYVVDLSRAAYRQLVGTSGAGSVQVTIEVVPPPAQ